MPQVSKRDQLLAAGATLVHRHGLAATGVAAIAQAAAAPKGSFYNHFASKDEFAAVVADRYLDDDRVVLKGLSDERRRSGGDRLHRYFEWLRTRAIEQRFVGCLLGNLSGELADGDDGLRQVLRTRFDEWTALLVPLIEDGVRDESIQTALPALELASCLVNAWEGALLRCKVEQNPSALDQFLSLMMPQMLCAASRCL